jgi:superfamily II RNA helicase
MAGRAGRRGKDPTGSCLISLDRAFGRNIPTLDDFEKLLENKGTPLESKLKLSYTMTMNVVKQESMVIDDLLKTSWFESENEKERINAGKNANQLKKLITKAEQIDCPTGCTGQLVKEYTKLYNEACQRNLSIFTVTVRDIVPLVLIESMKPTLYGEVLIVIQPVQTNKPTADDSMLCLFLK